MKLLKNFYIYIVSSICSLIKNIFIYMIKAYQLFISPMSAPSCKFTPTCSDYSKEAFKKLNLFKALFLSIKRILKCNPLSQPKYDPLPIKGKIYE